MMDEGLRNIDPSSQRAQGGVKERNGWGNEWEGNDGKPKSCLCSTILQGLRRKPVTHEKPPPSEQQDLSLTVPGQEFSRQ